MTRGWRKFHSDEFCHLPNIIMIMTRHIASMVDMRNIHNTLHRNTERKKSVGRPRGRWEVIKIGISGKWGWKA